MPIWRVERRDATTATLRDEVVKDDVDRGDVVEWARVGATATKAIVDEVDGVGRYIGMNGGVSLTGLASWMVR